MTDNEKITGSTEAFPIDKNTYQWTYRAMEVLFDFLKLKIHVHGDKTTWREGDIFLFNHFARFEAIIPQFLIYQKTRRYSRSIATKDLFTEDSLFSQYLKNLGGIPNNTKSLLYLVAKDIFKELKLVAFPEGGIVKDRLVMDDEGKHQVFSRSSMLRRKPHKGPAVIALAIAIFKSTVRQLSEKGDADKLIEWAAEIGLDNYEQLVTLSHLPTKIIPCCITFYPLRLSENMLQKSIGFVVPDVSKRVSEELLIEGNLLLKESDMDIQVGEPIVVEDYLNEWEGALLSILADHSTFSLKELFDTTKNNNTWGDRFFKTTYLRSVRKIRDDYMLRIYTGVTLNIAHVASTLIIALAKKGVESIPRERLHRLIYIVIKDLQLLEHLNFHPSLSDPSIYHRILYKKQENFEQFLRTMKTAGLLKSQGAIYSLSPSLVVPSEFDSIRYKNPAAVYANEASPIADLKNIIDETLSNKLEISSENLAGLLFDDELREFEADTSQFRAKRCSAINKLQTATQPPKPYLLSPEKPNGACVILVHGLLATPAEMRSLAEKLVLQGYIVIGTRLKGHGTSPWDLERTTWRAWYQSVKQSLRIAQFLSTNIHLVGFSCGALLTILLAGHKELAFKSIVLCSAPFVLKDRFASLSTVMDAGNKLVKAILRTDGIMPFKENDPEHPSINYNHIPISSISELLNLAEKAKPKVKRIIAPTLCLQATEDPVVEASSMQELLDELTSTEVETEWVESTHHGIIYQNTHDCQQRIISFIEKHTN
ncbi:MAG: hypothetical protein A6F71_01985 [Cycloclasticus sp. symbiont of Poecilosclerida sp. M]|nr:MAG: hypothetical protein A6F71_01985 [Cycloclasticus sp. symbiont of Poecilosclerida sp. M]